MNYQKTVSVRESNRHPIKPLSRQAAKLQAIPNGQMNQMSLPSPPLPPKKDASLLYKGQNSQSSYLKRVKVDSLRLKNDTDCWVKRQEKRNPWAPQVPVFFQNATKQTRKGLQTKGRSAKSFMIRKKNNSEYSKNKMEIVDTSKYEIQDLHKVVMNELFQHSKELGKKGFDEHPSINFTSIDQNCTKQKPKSVYETDYSFASEQDSKKIKPVICRDPKKIGKVLCDTAQTKDLPPKPSTDKKNIDSSRNIQNLLRKVRIASRSSLEDSKDSKLMTNNTDIFNDRNEDKLKSLQMKKGQSEKENRQRKNTGCKTIKMPWQTQGSYCKDSKKKLKPSEILEVKEDEPFGGISVIPYECKQGSSIERKQSMPIQSLQELYIQLDGQGIHTVETQSKELIQF